MQRRVRLKLRAFQHGVNDIMSDLFSIQDIFQALSEEIQQFIFFIGLNESKQLFKWNSPVAVKKNRNNTACLAAQSVRVLGTGRNYADREEWSDCVKLAYHLR